MRSWEGWWTILVAVAMVGVATLLRAPYLERAAGDAASAGLMVQPAAYVGSRPAAVGFRQEVRESSNQYVASLDSLLGSIGTRNDGAGSVRELERSQVALAERLGEYYPDVSGAHLRKLFRNHARLAARVVEASRRGSSSDLECARSHWYANAAQLSAELSRANPLAWPPEEVKPLLYSLLDATCDEAAARAAHRSAAVEPAAQRRLVLTRYWYDLLARGPIVQFPDRFRVAPYGERVAER